MSSSSPLISIEDRPRNYVIQQVGGDYFQNSNIALFIDKRLIKEIGAREGQVHLIARRALQAASVVAGFAGRIPFIEINLQLGGDNKVYGGFLAYGTCASFGYLVSYSLLEIVNLQMQPLSREEQVLMESRTSPSLKKVFFAASTVLGFGTQIPFAYIAYKYNEPSTLNPDGLVMPIMVFAIDSWVSVYSGYMGLKTLRERQSLTDYEKWLSGVRGKMHALIEGNRQLLAVVGKETRNDFIGSYERIKRIDSAPDRVKELYTLFTRRISDRTFNPPKYAKYIDYTVKSYGYLCAACNIGTLGYIAWLGTDELTDNLYADTTVTSLYVGTALYLNATAIPETAVILFNLFKDLFTCSYQPTLSDQLTPKLSFSLKALGLATAALSYGPAVELSRDYYGSHEGLEIFMEVTLSCATTFLVSMAILSITNQVLECKIEKMGNEEEKAIITIHKKMKLLASTLASSPLIETALFLKVLPQEAVEHLINETEITTSNLDQYIETHMPSRRMDEHLAIF